MRYMGLFIYCYIFRYANLPVEFIYVFTFFRHIQEAYWSVFLLNIIE